MTNQEQFEKWAKDINGDGEAGQKLVYDREQRCWRVMPEAEAAQKGYLNAKPEDMKVGSCSQATQNAS